MSLVDALPTDPSTDSLYDAFTDWTRGRVLSLYAHQKEADTAPAPARSAPWSLPCEHCPGR